MMTLKFELAVTQGYWN